MKANTSYSTVLILALVLSCTTLLNRGVSEWLALGLIILAGIPHGAFDLRAAETRWGSSITRRITLVATYVVIGISMSAFCLSFPGLGLLAFLVVSAAHFIEGERFHSSRSTAVCIGTGAIVLPIAFHASEASRYIDFFIPQPVTALAQPLIVAVAVLLSLALLVSLSNDRLHGRTSEILEHAVCFAAWCILPPLSGFCVWFIGRHSTQHFARAKTYLAIPQRALLSPDTLALSLLAIALLAPLTIWFDLTEIHQLFSASLILIAGLTLPHMVVTHLTREARQNPSLLRKRI
jgi:Brp/Blh family beta-carotene 15,15'-monooxygenase